MVHRARDEWRPDGTGTDGVHSDAFTDLLVVEATREGDDGTFRGCVVEQVGTADVCVYRGVVDDCIARL